MRLALTTLSLLLVALAVDLGVQGTDDPGGREAADPLIVTAAIVQFKQRHEAYGITCASCHGEALDFSEVPAVTTCLSCHGTHEQVAGVTAHLIPNPHHSHMGEQACTDCHSEHGEPRLSCNQCHIFDMRPR